MMIIVFRIFTAVIVFVAFFVLVSSLINSNKNKIDTENGIQESIYIDIDGMKQYIQIREENTENPVMLFNHGGPASAAQTALEKAEIRGTEDEKILTNLIKKMSQVKNYDDMPLDDLGQLVSVTSKYITCEGEISAFSQMITGITSPDMNFDDMKWFMSQMNTEKFFTQTKEIMEYAFFGFDIDMLSKNYHVPVYYLADKGDYAVCQKDV